MTLPNTTQTIETLQAKVEAVDMVDNLIKRNFELEEIHAVLQPLLYSLSMKLYPTDSPVSLGKLVEDAVKWIDEQYIEVIVKETLQ